MKDQNQTLVLEAKKLIRWSSNLIKGPSPSKLNDELAMWLRVCDIYGEADLDDAKRLLKWVSQNISRPSKFHDEVDCFLKVA